MKLGGVIMQTFLVGGAVRDEIMGQKSRDLDYTVVLSGNEDGWRLTTDPFKVMVNELRSRGYTIFLETPEYLTARAQTPDKKEAADFVLARRESSYSDGRRPDTVEPGDLYSDLSRRDFSINAIAKDENGDYIDPFNGQKDIANRIIRAVGDPFERLEEDALRAVRALRFSVTKGFTIDTRLRFAMQSATVFNAIKTKISDERIKDELSKMFRYDTEASIRALMSYPLLMNAMFSGTVSLDSTMKLKGRGK